MSVKEKDLQQGEMVVGPVKFIAKCHNQVLTMKPKRNQIVDGMVIVIEGEHIRFDRFEYITEDPREIEFIRNHRFFGLEITESAVGN